jgi:hypothetical protein
MDSDQFLAGILPKKLCSMDVQDAPHQPLTTW